MVTWSAYPLHIWEVLCTETSCHERYFTFSQSFHAVTMGSKSGHDYFLPHLLWSVIYWSLYSLTLKNFEIIESFFSAVFPCIILRFEFVTTWAKLKICTSRDQLIITSLSQYQCITISHTISYYRSDTICWFVHFIVLLMMGNVLPETCRDWTYLLTASGWCFSFKRNACSLSWGQTTVPWSSGPSLFTILTHHQQIFCNLWSICCDKLCGCTILLSNSSSTSMYSFAHKGRGCLYLTVSTKIHTDLQKKAKSYYYVIQLLVFTDRSRRWQQ